MNPLPLRNRRIVVTRPLAQAKELVTTLEALGAEVLMIPTIAVEDPTNAAPLLDAARRVADFDLVVFTSVNGVARFWEALRRSALDSGALSSVSICAIGEATARAIQREGAVAEVVPEEYVAESLIDALAQRRDLRGLQVLLPRAENARDLLPLQLAKMGAIVSDVPAYRTVPAGPPPPGDLARFRDGLVDAVTFTSSSAARSFAENVSHDLSGARIVSIGPITSKTIAELGWDVAIEANPHTTAGLVAAIVDLFRHTSPSSPE